MPSTSTPWRWLHRHDRPRLGLRLGRLIAAGNKYSAALITADGDIRLMVRETYKRIIMSREGELPGRNAATGVRGYTRRGLLREDDELAFGDDGDDLGDDTDEADGWARRRRRWRAGWVTTIEPEDESFDWLLRLRVLSRNRSHRRNDSPAARRCDALLPVTARNLVKRYGSFTAVDGVSFDIREGECFGMLGPNGAGRARRSR
ncbi:MAG: hypothetical protein R3C29_03210 [Dehalococcoidia bacterium]